jgi:hypothetical protein
MVSLLDIAPVKESVTIRGVDLPVNGLTAMHIASLFAKFPEIRRIVTTSSPGKNVIESLINRAPEAAGLLVCAGTGADLEDKEKLEPHLRQALSLNFGEQFEILQKVIDLTFPKGLPSFLEGLERLMVASGGALGKAPATTSSAPSSSASSTAETKTDAGIQPQGS